MARVSLFPLLAVSLLGAGCQSLIGLDQPTLADAGGAGDGGDHEHDAGVGDAAAIDASTELVAACDAFCGQVGQVCDGTSGAQAYNNEDACKSVCLYYDHDSSATDGATFACRAERASEALASKGSPGERPFVDTLCAMASPGGEGEADGVMGCGSNCENYCALRRAVCGDSVDLDVCAQQCAVLVDVGKVSAGSDFGEFPDTVQCRLAHVSMAATGGGGSGNPHCGHSQLNASRRSDKDLRCDLNAETVTRAVLCDNYCHLVTRTCTGAAAVWQDEAQCLAVCNNERGVPVGTIFDYTDDSWGCRRAHAYTALTLLGGDNAAHCTHASLGGGGSNHCGDPCTSFCTIAQSACPGDFSQRYEDLSKCYSNCEDFAPAPLREMPYNRALGAKGGDTYACRIHALIDVLAGDAGRCNAALGGGVCVKAP